VIAIAHRLSTIARMDRLIVLEQGRIVEQGTHDELLRLNGNYALLWKHQSGGFLPKDMPLDDAAVMEEPPVMEDAPVDEMRAAEQPEPNTNDEPMPARS
jgi:ATP-binding cassette subfamily B multidrug efflux pump